jgi:hypothetical protein
LLAGEGEALTRKAVELALAGNPAALRLCRERIARGEIPSVPKSWRWRGALPTRRRPTSPMPPSLNCFAWSLAQPLAE